MGFMDLFRTHFESGEKATDEALMTHYYKNNYQQTKAGLVEAAKELSFELTFEDDQRQELVLKRKDCEVIVTVVKINPIETTVDFTVNTPGIISFGKGKKIIASLYQALDKRLMFKGLALNR